jgi:hypothetical protein
MGYIKMLVKGHKVIKEAIQIKVDNTELWNLIRNTCFDEYDSVEGTTYWEYIGDNHHNDDPEYKKREATQEEIDVYKALKLLGPIFFEKSKGK